MLECLIIGDSIAVGTHSQRTECVAYAKTGINSQGWNQAYLKNNLSAKTVVISLGSNDHKSIRTKAELQRIREKVGVNSRVFWILPAGNSKSSGVDIATMQSWIKQIAAEYQDTVVPITKVSKDGVHPSSAGYRELAEKTK